MIVRACMVLVLAAAPVLGQPAGDAVLLWGGAEPPAGNIAELNAQGVRIVRADGASVLLDWSAVKGVTGRRAREFEAYRETAVQAWRADSRLERGDHVNAEPLFEELFDTYHADDGPTSSLVARGLLDCRLRSGATARAVTPWLGVLRAEGFSPEGAPPGAFDALMDPQTGLVPSLAPIWLPTEEAAWLARTGVAPDIAGTVEPGMLRSRLRALGVLYTLAARYETDPAGADAVRADLDQLVSGLDPRTLREPGVRLVFEIVIARVGAPEARASARASLQSRLADADLPGWREAWIRAAIGRSLLVEQDAELRRRGVVQLLHLPARLAGAPPTLIGLALAEAAVECKRLGDAEAADALRRDLLDNYPGHPAAPWAPIRDWGETPALGAAADPAHTLARAQSNRRDP